MVFISDLNQQIKKAYKVNEYKKFIKQKQLANPEGQNQIQEIANLNTVVQKIEQPHSKTKDDDFNPVEKNIGHSKNVVETQKEAP